MGIPAAFRWLSTKYPKIISPVIEDKPIEMGKFPWARSCAFPSFGDIGIFSVVSARPWSRMVANYRRVFRSHP